ncbi:MAG: hypothetical protein HYY95_28075 [Candidatus Rokubacteria bacterium]|nr:hypothetical protein [Candidatus Rokubacteria bacterium]
MAHHVHLRDFWKLGASGLTNSAGRSLAPSLTGTSDAGNEYAKRPGEDSSKISVS